MICYCRLTIAVCACALLASASGCASIMCGDTKTIGVQSDPSGAEFDVISAKGTIITQGRTPMNITLKRGRGYFAAGDYTVHFSKWGFEDQTMRIDQGFETGWYFGGNFVFGGLLGWFIIDPLTGAMWDIKDLHATLKPGVSLTATPPTPPPNYPKDRLKVDERGEPVRDGKGNFIFEPVKE